MAGVVKQLPEPPCRDVPPSPRFWTKALHQRFSDAGMSLCEAGFFQSFSGWDGKGMGWDGHLGGGNSNIFVIFTPKIGEDSHFDEYFSDGLKPPTSH